MSGSYYLDDTPDGSIDAPGEVEVYQVQLTGGQTYSMLVSGDSLGYGTLDDPAVAVLDPNGNVIVAQDDDGQWASQTGHDEYVEFTAPVDGTYTVAVADLSGGTGSYYGEIV